MTEGIDNYVFLDWKRNVMTNREADGRYAVHTSFVAPGTEIGDRSYIENSFIRRNVRIGKDCVVSGVDLEDVEIPDGVVMHGLKLKDGRYTVRIYGAEDNPKKQIGEGVPFLGTKLERFLEAYSLEAEALWPGENQAVADDPGKKASLSGRPAGKTTKNSEKDPAVTGQEDRSLWTARLYPVCGSMEEAVQAALELYELVCPVKEGKTSTGRKEVKSEKERRDSVSDRNDPEMLLSR